MYNKLFQKIVFSSVWNESLEVRVLWVAMLAQSDKEGFVHCATIQALSRISNLDLESTKKAVKILESPDENSSDPEYEGRRIEKMQGCWFILNFPKYAALANTEVAREQNRLRQAKFRNKKGKSNGRVTVRNGRVTVRNEKVTPIDIDIDRDIDIDTDKKEKSKPKKIVARFAPPLPAQVNEYLELEAMDSMGNDFCDFYASKGWMVGKNKMIDWKAAARRWKKSNQEKVDKRSLVERMMAL